MKREELKTVVLVVLLIIILLLVSHMEYQQLQEEVESWEIVQEDEMEQRYYEYEETEM